MISLAQSRKQRDAIVLTDQWMECSRVVKRALGIIWTLEVGALDSYNTNTLLYVLDFAEKWDIPMIPKLMIKEIRRWLKLSQCPAFDLLQLSLKLKSNELSAEVIGTKLRQSWQANRKYTALSQPASLDRALDVVLLPNYRSEIIPSYHDPGHPSDGDTFDFGIMPHSFFLQLPPTVVWAMLRAQHLSKHDAVAMQDHFEALMDLVCECVNIGVGCLC